MFELYGLTVLTSEGISIQQPDALSAYTLHVRDYYLHVTHTGGGGHSNQSRVY